MIYTLADWVRTLRSHPDRWPVAADWLEETGHGEEAGRLRFLGDAALAAPDESVLWVLHGDAFRQKKDAVTEILTNPESVLARLGVTADPAWVKYPSPREAELPSLMIFCRCDLLPALTYRRSSFPTATLTRYSDCVTGRGELFVIDALLHTFSGSCRECGTVYVTRPDPADVKYRYAFLEYQ